MKFAWSGTVLEKGNPLIELMCGSWMESKYLFLGCLHNVHSVQCTGLHMLAQCAQWAMHRLAQWAMQTVFQGLAQACTGLHRAQRLSGANCDKTCCDGWQRKHGTHCLVKYKLYLREGTFWTTSGYPKYNLHVRCVQNRCVQAQTD